MLKQLSVLGLLAAKSLKNTDSLDIHLGPHELPPCRPPGPGAAADFAAGYIGFLRRSGLGARHFVVLRVGGRRGHASARRWEFAQSLENADFGGGDFWRRSRGGSGRVRRRTFKFPSEASQADGGCFGGGLFLRLWGGPFENACVLQDRTFSVALLLVFIHGYSHASWLRRFSAFVRSVEATEHPSRLLGTQTHDLRTGLYLDATVCSRGQADRLTLLLLVVVSAIDSAPSRSNTEVRFRPFEDKNKTRRFTQTINLTGIVIFSLEKYFTFTEILSIMIIEF